MLDQRGAKLTLEDMNTKRQYTDEFRAQIVELAESGKPVTEISKEFGLNKSLINTWRRKARHSGQSRVGSETTAAHCDSVSTDELRSLRRRVADLELENDILKKAALILGTKPQGKSKR